MNFLAPGWLLLLLLVPLLLWLHSRRLRSVVVPSLMLWRRIDAQSRPTRAQFPRPTIPLVLQVLFVVAAAFALARPELGGEQPPAHRVFVPDASGSMRATDIAPSRFDAAMAEIERRLAAEPPGAASRVSVILAGPEALFVAARIGEGEVLPARGTLAATDGAADWEGVAGLLPSLLRAGERSTVTLLTDNADDPLQVLGGAAGETPIEVARVGTSGTANAGITASLTPLDEGAGLWRISGRVAFAGAPPPEVSVKFRPERTDIWLDWAAVAFAETDETAGGVAEFSHDVELPGAGVLRLTLPDDSGPHDNEVHFVLRPGPAELAILMVGNVDPSLLRAFGAIPRVAVSSAETMPATAETFDLVVVDGVAVDRVPATSTLWLGGAHLAGEAEPATIEDPYPTAWRGDHWLARSVAWGAITPGRAYGTAPPAGAETLFESGETPLVWSRTTTAGREVRVAIDLAATDWVGQPGFAVFVQNLIEWLGPRSATRLAPSCVAGQACAIDPRFLAGTIAPVDGGAEPRPLLGPLGEAGWIPRGLDGGFTPARAGLFRLEGGGRSALLAVDPPATESRLDPAPTAEAPAASRALPAIWWWLLAVGLVLLAAEAWIAGRGTERFLQRTSLRWTTPHARRRALILGLRAASLVLILVALIGLPVIVPRNAEAVVLVRPEGAAVPAGLIASQTRLATVATGSSPGIATDLGAAEPNPTATPDRSWPGSDLERALALAAAALPADAAGRIVVVGGANESAGEAAQALAALRARGIAVDVAPGATPAADVAVRSVGAPAQLFAGDGFPLDAVLDSDGARAASVSVLVDGEPIAISEASLLPGSNRLESAMPAVTAGRHLYEVAVTGPGDAVPGNDRNGTIVEVAERPSVLIVTPQPEAGAEFAEALGLQDIETVVVRPQRAPFYMDEWLAHDAVALLNVPAIDLTTQQQGQIRDYVGEHGRGLLILGGENSFGPGGYYQTALEEISPLSARVPRDAPKAAMVFVLDRSGSMQQMVGEVSRLAIAKMATLAAADLLHEESQVGVIVFDSASTVIVPLQARKDMAAIEAALQPLEPAGGTSIHPGLVDALAELRGVDAAARHIVVMTDGLSQPADFPAIVADIVAEGITVSTVAIGDRPDIERLQEIARLGGGAYHATADFEALPSILSQEALLLSGTPTEERLASPDWTEDASPWRPGLPEAMPPVRGYVLTSAKPAADVLLTVEDDDGETTPLMAAWRYGAGQVLSLATHGAGEWAADWMAMEDYPLLFAKIVRRVVGGSGDGPSIALERSGDEIGVRVVPGSSDGQPVSVTLLRPGPPEGGGAPETLRLVPDGGADGALVARVRADRAGAYLFSLDDDGAMSERAVHVAYPALLDASRADPDLLPFLAAATGGRVLAAGEAIPRESAWRLQRIPGWPFFLGLAVVLFLAEMLARYRPGLLQMSRRPLSERAETAFTI